MRTIFIRAAKIIFLILMINSFMYTQAGAEETDTIVKVFPESSFINASNMAPGDNVSSKVKVIYEGQNDTNVHLSSRMEKGSPELYQVLTVTITDGNTEIFSGSLMDLNNLYLGKLLGENDAKKLSFTLGLPLDLGNTFQGAETVVAFDFSSTAFPAEYQEGSLLPNTATNTFNLLLIGISFVLGGLSVLVLYNKKMKELE